MWDINNGLIQIEVGSNVVKRFTDSDYRDIFDKIIGIRAPDTGGLFISETNKLRAELEEQDIFLPSVKFFDSSDILPDQFQIYIGLNCFPGNITQNDLFESLKYGIFQMQLSDPSAKTVNDIFMEGVQYYQNRDYNKAIKNFALVYYWANILPDCENELINSLINIGTIMFLNNRINDALTYMEHTVLLVEAPSFFNPYLKFNAHNFLAGIYWIMEKKEVSIDNYKKAIIDVQYLDDTPLYVFALWNTINTYMQIGNYTASAALLDKIFSLIIDNKDFSKETIQKLYSLRAQVSDQQIRDLQEENYHLTLKLTELTNELNTSIGGTAVKFVYAHSDVLINFFGGYLLGAINNIEYNKNSKNTIVLNCNNQ